MLLFTLPPQVRLDALLPGLLFLRRSTPQRTGRVRLGVSLAAAAHGKGRVLARLGRVGES